jgi:N-acetylmuramoyl-L-alanine amidase
MKGRVLLGEWCLVALLGAAPSFAAPASKSKPASRPAAAAAPAPTPGRPDGVLYRDAKKAESTLMDSPRLQAKRAEWDKVIALHRKLVARYPRSGYADNALLSIGDLSKAMAARFKSPRLLDDALQAYRTLVAEYPSSSLGEHALYSTLEIAQASGDRKRMSEAGRAYLDAYPDADRAKAVKTLLRKQVPEKPLPSPPPPGLAQVFDLRFWSGDGSTRVVIDLAKKVEFQFDRLSNPDRLFVDLKGTRLHPNLTSRMFPVGDGLLAQVRLAQNTNDVVRVVLDFKEVYEHNVFYLQEEGKTRLVIDVRGHSAKAPLSTRTADATAPPNSSSSPTPAPSPDRSASKPEGPRTGDRLPALAEPDDVELPPPGPAVLTPPSPSPSPATAGADPIPARRLNGLLPAEPAPSGNSKARRTAVVVDSTPPNRGATASSAPAPAVTASLPAHPSPNRDGSYSLARQLGLGARRIVIDAGHGGHDPGTIGRGGLMEKDLVLDVALRLEKMVREELGAEVIMTRSTDVFIELSERTAIASTRDADLFLSIHANASRNPTARGIETYFLNFAKNAHAETVAARENAISTATLKDLQGLVKAITTNSKIDESRDFATSIQEAMVQHQRDRGAPVEDRGVHTAPFYVLIGANMPSVLAEIAFVSNPDEEVRLKTPEVREQIARSLAKGVRSYLEVLNRAPNRQLTDAAPRTTVSERTRETRKR